MARPRTSQFWVNWVKGKLANEPTLSLARIAEQAQQHGARETIPGAPSARQVGRIRQEFFRLSEPERHLFSDLSWPESFEQGSLPWEHQQMVFELMRHCDSRLEVDGDTVLLQHRPTIMTARWYCRLRQAAPEADVGLLLELAELLVLYGQNDLRLSLVDNPRISMPASSAVREYVQEVLRSGAGNRAPSFGSVFEGVEPFAFRDLLEARLDFENTEGRPPNGKATRA